MTDVVKLSDVLWYEFCDDVVKVGFNKKVFGNISAVGIKSVSYTEFVQLLKRIDAYEKNKIRMEMNYEAKDFFDFFEEFGKAKHKDKEKVLDVPSGLVGVKNCGGGKYRLFVELRSLKGERLFKYKTRTIDKGTYIISFECVVGELAVQNIKVYNLKSITFNTTNDIVLNPFLTVVLGIRYKRVDMDMMSASRIKIAFSKMGLDDYFKDIDANLFKDADTYRLLESAFDKAMKGNTNIDWSGLV